MNKEKINILIKKSFNSLTNFTSYPEKDLEELILNLDSLENFLSVNKMPFLLEKVQSIYDIVFNINKYFENKLYYDIDLLEEIVFFLKGALSELSNHLEQIKDGDLESLKNSHWQKIFFLKNWVEEFLKLPPTLKVIQKEQFEKFMIFLAGENQYSIPLNFFCELILLESESQLNEGKLLYKNKMIPLIDHELIFGKLSKRFPKPILVFKPADYFLALEVDNLINSEELDINKFIPIENISGIDYEGPIKYIAIKEENPIFVLNPPNSYHWPLTSK